MHMRKLSLLFEDAWLKLGGIYHPVEKSHIETEVGLLIRGRSLCFRCLHQSAFISGSCGCRDFYLYWPFKSTEPLFVSVGETKYFVPYDSTSFEGERFTLYFVEHTQDNEINLTFRVLPPDEDD